MLELYQQSITAYTLPATVVLILCIIYWAFVMLGALDIDALDFGGPAEGADLDIDLDVDVDSDLDGPPSSSSGGWWHQVLDFFNLVEVPAMVVLSILSLSVWFLQVNLNSAFNTEHVMGLGFLLLMGSLTASAFITKFVTKPLVPLFARLNHGEDQIEIIGQEGIVKSLRVDEEFGQVEVIKSGAPLLLNARTAEGAEPIENGVHVLIYREDKEKGIYIVRTL